MIQSRNSSGLSVPGHRTILINHVDISADKALFVFPVSRKDAHEECPTRFRYSRLCYTDMVKEARTPFTSHKTCSYFQIRISVAMFGIGVVHKGTTIHVKRLASNGLDRRPWRRRTSVHLCQFRVALLSSAKILIRGVRN